MGEVREPSGLKGEPGAGTGRTGTASADPRTPQPSTHSSGRYGDLKVYVAGSTRDVERVNRVQQLVRDAGWTITFDWTGAEGEIRTDGSWDTVPDVGARIATREIDACRDADLTILLFPPHGGGLGCWIEMGATLASGGDVWVIEPGRDSVFWQHPNVVRFESIAEMARSFPSARSTRPWTHSNWRSSTSRASPPTRPTRRRPTSPRQRSRASGPQSRLREVSGRDNAKGRTEL